MGRTVDTYQWRLLFFKQCKYSWLLSKHYWCTIRSHCASFERKVLNSITVSADRFMALITPGAVPHWTWQHLMNVVFTSPFWHVWMYTISFSVIELSLLPSTSMEYIVPKISKIHLSTLILTCLWMSKRVLTKALWKDWKQVLFCVIVRETCGPR